VSIFNDGTDAFLHPGNGSYSAIDLTVRDQPFNLQRGVMVFCFVQKHES